MWVENQDPEKHSCVISRCYTKSEKKDLYPLIAIDVNIELNELETHIWRRADSRFGWVVANDEPDWIIAEKEEMLNIAKEKIGGNA